MASKSAETYCSIGKYIAKTDPKLYELLEDACLTGLFNSGGKTGITFLRPTDKAWRKKFEDLVHSSTVGSKPAAEDMIRALVFRGIFKKGRDWIEQKDNIPNALFPSQHVPVKSANDKEVLFESGARAEPDHGFTDDSRKKNLAVWTLVSGDIPVTTDRPAKYVPPTKRGQYEPEPSLTSSRRFQIGKIVETEYARDELNRRQSGSHNPSQCYLKYTLSLVNYLINTDNLKTLKSLALPNISYDKFDFYVLVEPHTAAGPYLLDDGIIEGWWADTSSRMFDIDAMKNTAMKMQCTPVPDCPCALYKSRGSLLEEIHRVRNAIRHGRPLESAKSIVEEYKRLESSNTIGAIQHAIPSDLASYFASKPGLKLTHDELRYITYLRFAKLESASAFDLGDFNYITNYIGDRLHAATETARTNLRTLVNPVTLQTHIRPKEQLTEIGIFVNSTMFMFIPQCLEDTRGVTTKYTVERPYLGGPHKFFNIQEAIHGAQIRILPELSGEYREQVASWLRTLKPEDLTSESAAQLKKLLA